MTTLRRGKGVAIVTKSHKQGEIVKIYRATRTDGVVVTVYEVRLQLGIAEQLVKLRRGDFDFSDSIIKWDAIKRIEKASKS
jgi:hypothetical protein